MNFGKLLICKEFVFVAVRRFPSIPACHAGGSGSESRQLLKRQPQAVSARQATAGLRVYLRP